MITPRFKKKTCDMCGNELKDYEIEQMLEHGMRICFDCEAFIEVEWRAANESK